MIRKKIISLEKTEGQENKIIFELGNEGERYRTHIGLTRGADNHYKGITFGKFREETLEEIVSLFERFLAQKTDASISKTFEIMLMESKSLHAEPQWKKKGSVEISFHEKDGKHSMRFELSRYRGQTPTLPIFIGDNKEVIKQLIQFFRDSLKSPLNIEKPKAVPEEIENAGKRLDIAIEKFYMGDDVGAIKEAREAFHVVKGKEEWLKDELPKDKVNNLLASRKQFEGWGLHEEDRGETTTSEDAEFVLRDIANMLNFISDSS